MSTATLSRPTSKTDPRHRALLYARISEDATGKALGVKAQLAATQRHAEGAGLTVVGEFHDNDISQYAGKPRPDFDRLRDALRNGLAGHVVVTHSSRLFRSVKDAVEFMDEFGPLGVIIREVNGPGADLGSASGQGLFGAMTFLNRMESGIKAERVRDAAAARARGGRPSSGLGYGWTKVGMGRDATWEVNDDEAVIVRRIVRQVTQGESLRAITDALNAAGVPSPEGLAWAKSSVRKIALRPSNVADRIHHRGRADETVTHNGTWPAIVDRDEWERASAIMSAPSRRSHSGPRPGARKHLLSSGIGECGVCGATLKVGNRGNAKRGHRLPAYLCNEREHVGRNMARVDDLVRAEVVKRLRLPDAMDYLLGDADAAREARALVQRLEIRLKEKVDDWGNDRITRAEFYQLRDLLVPQIEDAERTMREHARTTDLSLITGLAEPEGEARWDAMSVTQRRAVLEALGVRVTILRTTHRGPGFDPTSVQVTFWAS